jgi:hypothetical protein
MSRSLLEFVTRLLALRDGAFRKAMGNAMAQNERSISERCRTAIGSWWQASSRNAQPDESWYWEYWFEREHSPDLAFLIAKRLRTLFRWLIGGLRLSPTVVKARDVGDASSTEVGRRWTPMRNHQSNWAVQRRRQTDDATA